MKRSVKADIAAKEAITVLDNMKPGSNESSHLSADELILKVLSAAEFQDVVDAFNRADDRVKFWYA